MKKKKEGLKITRRQFLKGAAATGIGMALPLKFGVRSAHAFAQSPNLTKFVQELRSVGGVTGGDPSNFIPVAASDGSRYWKNGAVTTSPPSSPYVQATHYTIDIGQFRDHLHPDSVLSANGTTLWGYGQDTSFTHLGGIIIAGRGTPIQITFRNKLSPGNSVFNHIIPLDATIPGANQAYNRTAVHLHGGLVPWISDGGPHDWWTPNALESDPIIAGTHGLSFLNNSVLNPLATSGLAEYYYPNNQSARFAWYHDHAWGITRINAYAGIASGYVFTDDYEGILVGSTAVNLPNPAGNRTFYLVFQDKIFVWGNAPAGITPGTGTWAVDPTWATVMPNSLSGDLWYAHVYDPTRWVLGPTPSGPPPDPSVIPEFFGDTILVNGTVYPFIRVTQSQYRFRLLNACNARFLTPRLVYAQGTTGIAATEPSPNVAGPAFIQIGSEGGFLPTPVPVNGKKQLPLLLAPAERADLIVDFSAVPVGSRLILYNDAPAPFPKGDARNDYYPGNPKTPTSIPGSGPNTRTLLQIQVVAGTGPAITLPAAFTPTDPFLVPQTLGVPTPFTITGATTATIKLANGTTVPATFRQLTLSEAFDARGRLIQYIGTNVVTGLGGPGQFGREYMDTPTEKPNAGDYEIWEIANLTGDTHPIHFHLVNVQILSRQPFSVKTYKGIPNYLGPAVAPDANELGWKETVRMNPGEVTRVFMKFDLAPVPFAVPPSPRTGDNEYVYHCHILEHEEHDMMRPLVVIGANPTFGVDPNSRAIKSGTVQSVTFEIFGGVSPYTVAPTTFGANISGNTLTVNVLATTTPQTVVYTISDSTSQSPLTVTATLIVV